MVRKILLLFGILFCMQVATAQKLINLQVGYTNNIELQEYYNFEGIEYIKLKFTSTEGLPQYFALTSSEYLDGKLHKLDTIVNTKKLEIKNSSDQVQINIMTKKVNEKTSKFQFTLPRFTVLKEYQVESTEKYILSYLNRSGINKFNSNEIEDILVYTGPYTKPETSGLKYYCDYRDGTPTDQWSERFGINHYIVFEIQFFD